MSVNHNNLCYCSARLISQCCHNSPFTANSFCGVLSFIVLTSNTGFFSVMFSSALYWCLSIKLTSAPLSGSTLTSISFILNASVFAILLTPLTFFTWLKWLTAWLMNSSSELKELSISSSVVFFTKSLCGLNLLLQVVPCMPMLSFPVLLLQTAAKWFHLPQFLHCLPYAGQSFPAVWNPVR